MEFHLPGHVRTLRDFLTHIGIVTLGILIALGLEQLVDSHHRATQAREAVAAFRRELEDNRAQVKEVMAAMPQLRAQIAEQVALLAAPPADSRTAQPIKYPGIHFNLVSSSSWDAIATQALNEIPYQDAKRYGEAYGVFRFSFDEERNGLTAWQDMRSFGSDATPLSAEQRMPRCSSGSDATRLHLRRLIWSARRCRARTGAAVGQRIAAPRGRHYWRVMKTTIEVIWLDRRRAHTGCPYSVVDRQAAGGVHHAITS
jgi:hypothetical protein